MRKNTLATMKSSHERFGTYPEVNGRFPVDGTLNDTIATLNAELAEQAKTPTTPVTAYKVPSQSLSNWGDDELPKEMSTTRTLRMSHHHHTKKQHKEQPKAQLN